MSVETVVLKREDADALATKYRPGPSASSPPKEIIDIPHSLLCAKHIELVVKKTGTIAPFHTGGGRKSRLKMSAYEGRIGDTAYIYDENGDLKKIFDRSKDENLRVPRNQIVFIECDLDFRIPEFIALRFNLQIQHVHRGLLLGTGPLIDPGYWGKLCIPLHNLTDEDYVIPKDEGIIWIEFTKTTSIPDDAQNPIGRPPLDAGAFFNDITVFLNKASKQYGVCGVPIRSALPTMFLGAKKSAENAERVASSIRNWVLGLGVATALAAVFSVAAIYFQAVSVVQDASTSIRSVEESAKTANASADKNRQINEEIETLKRRLRDLEMRFKPNGK